MVGLVVARFLAGMSQFVVILCYVTISEVIIFCCSLFCIDSITPLCNVSGTEIAVQQQAAGAATGDLVSRCNTCEGCESGTACERGCQVLSSNELVQVDADSGMYLSCLNTCR